MRLDFSLAAHTARMAGLGSLIMSAGNGKLLYYDDTAPAPGDPAMGTLLATQDITAVDANAGGLDLTLLTVDALATGIPAWCRITAGDDTWVLDGDVGGPTDDCLITLDHLPVQFYEGGEISATSARIDDG